MSGISKAAYYFQINSRLCNRGPIHCKTFLKGRDMFMCLIPYTVTVTLMKDGREKRGGVKRICGVKKKRFQDI